MSARWPWNVVDGFEVSSLASGEMNVRPKWNPKFYNDEGEGGPGVLTRLAMATWIKERLQKRGAKALAATESQ